MNTIPAMVPTIMDEADDFTVIATNPAAMQEAQRSLILWAARKIQGVKEEIASAREQLELARKNKWSPAAWSREVAKHEKRAEYYRKIKMALEAGYYIVPPFPIDVFAIRTKRDSPNRYDGTSPDNHDQMAQLLPAGEGRYVDPKPVRAKYLETERKPDGTTKQVAHYYASDYQPVDFPFKLAKAEIRAATDAAMGLKVFDRLGVLPRQRAPDPIVCGEILIPGQTFYRWSNPKSVMFFVAWWLDTKTL